MSKIILGFDVSSTTIGYGVLGIDDNTKQISFISVNYLKPPKSDSIIDRLSATRDQINQIVHSIQPTYIAIEDIIQFMAGKSTAKTIITLTSFNRMICLLARDYLQVNPQLFSVMSIRHGLKLNKQLPKKEDMPDLVSHHLGIKFPWQYNKKGFPKTECFDQADGLAVALHYARILTGKNKKSGNKTSRRSK